VDSRLDQVLTRSELYKPKVVKYSLAAACGLSLLLFTPSIQLIALHLRYFGSIYVREEAFSQLKVIISRYRSLLTYEHSKFCLHLCLSDYEVALAL